MAAPSAEELAAIAAAYLAVARAATPAVPARASRWVLAARIPELAEDRVVLAARTTRWNAASRLDG